MTSELELLTDVDMIVLAEKTIRDRRCHYHTQISKIQQQMHGRL